MRTKHMMLVTLGCLLLWTTTAAFASDHHEHSLTVGKKGEITLTKPTEVGDKVLQPGTYVVQHRTSGDSHFVRFIELKQVEDSKGEQKFTYTERNNADEVRCTLEPSGATAKETTVTIRPEGGGDRITKVTIKGENVVHEIGRAPRD
jgi:hypothetical protein